jgi:hypothetical protein
MAGSAFKDKIFVSVVVSRPERLTKLPGALTAGRRMCDWADKNDYHVVSIDDAVAAVTTDLIREKVVEAIEYVQAEVPLKRLVFFFAGHGAIKGINEPYWLLSNWWREPDEAIDLVAFQRMLRFYQPKQVSLIGDACQVVHRDFLDVNGSSILHRRGEDPVRFELDQFFAADAGEQAFMIRGDDNVDPFCIFTEVLLDALEGDAIDAFEDTGAGELRVTSGSLTQYLNAEIPLAAGRHALKMIPMPQPGFYTDCTYARFPRSKLPSTSKPPEPSPSPQSGGPSDSRRDKRSKIDSLRAQQAEKKRQIKAELEMAQHIEAVSGACSLVLHGATVREIEGFPGTVHERDSQRFEINVGSENVGRDWTDLLVTLDDGRHIYTCAIYGFETSILVHDSRAISVVQRPVFTDAMDSNVTNEVLAKLGAGLLNRPEIIDLATKARSSKHFDFTLGCLAAYLYTSIGDVDGCRSIASFYNRYGQAIPLDVAILSGGVIRQNERSELVVDIAETAPREARTPIESAHSFSIEGTPRIIGAEVAGRAPWFRSGWRALEAVQVDATARGWLEAAREVVSHLNFGEFTSVSDQGFRELRTLLVRDEVFADMMDA